MMAKAYVAKGPSKLNCSVCGDFPQNALMVFSFYVCMSFNMMLTYIGLLANCVCVHWTYCSQMFWHHRCATQQTQMCLKDMSKNSGNQFIAVNVSKASVTDTYIGLTPCWISLNKYKYEFPFLSFLHTYYSDIMMCEMPSQITSISIVCSIACSCADQGTSKLIITGLCEGNPSVTGRFPSQRASNAENVSIW